MQVTKPRQAHAQQEVRLGERVSQLRGSAAVFDASAGQWKLNSDNYLGVLSIEGDGSVLKAWVRIAVGTTNLQRTIVDWAYELDGGALTVGAVPAPGAAALLALAGVMGRRRRS